MAESFKSRLFRWWFNFFPAYRRTGGRITYIAGDLHEVRVKLPLNWKTRNYVGSLFGGSMYGAIDPIYMIMLIKLLGPEFVVWDKAATIHFKKPGRGTLFAHFLVEKEELEEIRRQMQTENSINRSYQVDLVDNNGVVCASFAKTLYIRNKNADAKRNK